MKTIAIAGAGDFAKFVVEALEEAGAYKIVVISRARREWFATRKSIEIHITDYSLKSLKPLLVDVDVLFSCLHDNTSFYVQGHNALLQACISSPRCKRFVPSEYGGDIDKFPCIPRFYKHTHCAFREILRSKDHGVEWTLINAGYFMDYFLPPEKTHMKPLPTVWPIGDKKATIPGFGNEPIGFTLARDVARGLIKLIEAPEWDEHIYMCAEITTWNDLLDRMRSLGLKKPDYPVAYITPAENEKEIEKHINDTDPDVLWHLYMHEWSYSGASAPPTDVVKVQRQKYFSDVRFETLQELLEASVPSSVR